MKNYVIYNWKSGKLMDYNFNAVSKENAEIYDDLDFALDEIDSRGEPFCKVIDIADLEIELQKSQAYKNLGGISFFSLKYGQKFRVLQKGWEGKTFVFQPQKFQPNRDIIILYEKENHEGAQRTISGNIAAALKVEVIE